MDISVVIPVYGCRDALTELHRRLVSSLETITERFEIILVNDACPQNSWETIKQLAMKDHRVKGIDLSRNFGQIRAITAGLSEAIGELIVVMDCDLQDTPEEIPRLYKKADEGYDVVFSRRATRKDRLLKRLLSKLFHVIYGYFTDGAFDATVSNFSISKRTVIDNYLKMRDQNRAFILFIRWMGFRTTVIDVDHRERATGRSAYNLRKQLRLAGEIISTQSNKPLTLSIKIGCAFASISFLYAVYRTFLYFIDGVSVAGWTTIIVSIWFLSGVTMVQLGVIGLYLGLVFNQTKQRPIFIVREVVGRGTSETLTSTNHNLNRKQE